MLMKNKIITDFVNKIPQKMLNILLKL